MEDDHREATDAEKVDMALRRLIVSLCAPLWWESDHTDL
jgi:hypothetical protein